MSTIAFSPLRATLDKALTGFWIWWIWKRFLRSGRGIGFRPTDVSFQADRRKGRTAPQAENQLQVVENSVAFELK
jgi:hypothetical protein